MRDQKLYESVGKYIDKYYIDKPDDIKLDKEMKSIFDRISEFRKKKATKKCNAEEDTDIEIDESAVESFDVESMQKMKATDAMSSTLATNRNIESLMGQMDETFSQRLLLNVESYDWELLEKFVENTDTESQISFDTYGLDETAEQLKQLIKIGKVMAQKYEVVFLLNLKVMHVLVQKLNYI